MFREPLFLKFLNRSITVFEILQSFCKSSDKVTVETAKKTLYSPPDLEAFREEFTDAVRDLVNKGLGEEFKAFVDNYMSPSLEEDVDLTDGQFGQNVSRFARIKDTSSTWIEGFICYNISLYIRAFGLDSLKICRVCDKFFAHKGKWAVYCSDGCKAEGRKKKHDIH